MPQPVDEHHVVNGVAGLVEHHLKPPSAHAVDNREHGSNSQMLPECGACQHGVDGRAQSHENEIAGYKPLRRVGDAVDGILGVFGLKQLGIDAAYGKIEQHGIPKHPSNILCHALCGEAYAKVARDEHKQVHAHNGKRFEKLSAPNIAKIAIGERQEFLYGNSVEMHHDNHSHGNDTQQFKLRFSDFHK